MIFLLIAIILAVAVCTRAGRLLFLGAAAVYFMLGSVYCAVLLSMPQGDEPWHELSPFAFVMVVVGFCFGFYLLTKWIESRKDFLGHTPQNKL